MIMGGKFLQRLIGGLFGLALISSTACAGTNDRLSEVRLPPGFSIEIFASAPGVRAITVSTELKTVFAGSTDHAVYGIPFAGEKAGKTLLLKAGLTVPHGVAWRDGYLYVGEQHRISRYRGDSLQALSKARPETIFDDLTDSGWHGRRDLAFGPDGKLYVSAGSGSHYPHEPRWLRPGHFRTRYSQFSRHGFSPPKRSPSFHRQWCGSNG